MLARDLHRELRTQLGPMLRARGYRRRTAGVWHRALGKKYVLVWCQASKDYDRVAGSSFTVEFEVSPSTCPGGSPHRLRWGHFLSAPQLGRADEIHDAVIRALPPVPKEHVAFTGSPEVALWYRGKFDPRTDRPRGMGGEPWMRYARPEDVQRWCELLLELLPDVLEHVEAFAAGTGPWEWPRREV